MLLQLLIEALGCLTLHHYIPHICCFTSLAASRTCYDRDWGFKWTVRKKTTGCFHHPPAGGAVAPPLIFTFHFSKFTNQLTKQHADSQARICIHTSTQPSWWHSLNTSKETNKKRQDEKACGDDAVRPVVIGWTCELCSDWLKQCSPAFEEGDVNRRWVEVDKLEDENFEDEHVFIFSLSPMHLLKKHTQKCCNNIRTHPQRLYT